MLGVTHAIMTLLRSAQSPVHRYGDFCLGGDAERVAGHWALGTGAWRGVLNPARGNNVVSRWSDIYEMILS